MKQQVTVDGITSTRVQIERALTDLNAPDPFVQGDIVCFGNAFRVVITQGNVAQQTTTAYGAVPASDVRAMDLRNGCTYTCPASCLTLVKKVTDW